MKILILSAFALSACTATNGNLIGSSGNGGFQDQCAASALTTYDCQVIVNDDETVEDRGGVTEGGNPAPPVIVTSTPPEPIPVEPTPETQTPGFGPVSS